MLKKKFKWAIMPVVAIAAFVSFSAFTSNSENEEVYCPHAKCITGSSRHCNYRDCTTPKCIKEVESCDVAGRWDYENCKS